MAVIPWVGARRVAVVPVLDMNVDREPPPDWEYQVRKRVFYDPQPGGLDQSFQHYLQANSYGKAILEGEVFPLVRSPDAAVNIPAMKSLPPGHGYKYLLAVLPHDAGEHRGGHAFRTSPKSTASPAGRASQCSRRPSCRRVRASVSGARSCSICSAS